VQPVATGCFRQTSTCQRPGLGRRDGPLMGAAQGDSRWWTWSCR